MRARRLEHLRHESVLHVIKNDDDDIPRMFLGEVAEAEVRARRVGAVSPLTFLGMGMTGIVFCDARHHGFKVAREGAEETVANEAEWLSVASTVPEIKLHVARFIAYDPHWHVIERACVKADRRERSGTQEEKWALIGEIARVMEPYGLGRPEFKSDSFVWSRGRGWVLVDAGFAVRKGRRLMVEATSALSGRKRLSSFKLQELAWEVRAESGRTIDPTRAERLSERLLAMSEGRAAKPGRAGSAPLAKFDAWYDRTSAKVQKVMDRVSHGKGRGRR